MLKPRLQLIHCSDGIADQTNRRVRGFQPAVIDGGRRTNSVAVESPWAGLLDLFELGALIAQANYLALLAATLAALGHQGWPESERTH